eukprot:ANDGO_04286.mRNA.1 Adenylosuccinate lyase
MGDWAFRYQTSVSEIFSDERRLKHQLQVELMLLKVLGRHGLVPSEAYERLQAAVSEGRVNVQRVLEIEKEIHHDIMAMVKALAECDPQYGEFVHFSATSQDINDTVMGLQLSEAKTEILNACTAVRKELTRISKDHRDLVCIARTHGQHAIPTTMGFKFANFLYELSEASNMLENAPVHFGKLTGAVGTFAALNNTSVQREVLEELGLSPVPITTQVITRIHLARFAFALSAIASSLERLGKEIRNLQRSEIGELFEGFSAKQVGSSTMPQKRNPHKSERICGLVRVIRAQISPIMETIALEHERDLTNSSVERVTISTGCVLTHYCLLEMQKILRSLAVDTDHVERNLQAAGGNQLAERVMMFLAPKLGRQEAHEMLRVAVDDPRGIRSILDNSHVQQVMTSDEFDKLMDPHTYVGQAPQVVDDVLMMYGVQ